MSARTVRCFGARGPCARAVPTLLVLALGGLVACGEDSSPTEPSLKPAPVAAFTVSPTALRFIVPRPAPATLTLAVSSKAGNTITATSSSATCQVSPASVVLVKPRGMGDYTGSFTVGPIGATATTGACTITLTDKKGGQTIVPVTLAASQVRLRQARIATGIYHTCALTADGDTWCWGANQDGPLGDGTTTPRSTPAPVTGGQKFTSLTAGVVHTCGLTAAGAAYCWGSAGQVGDGSAIARTVPTLVAGGFTFIQLTASGRHTCGLTAAGAAYCWGFNRHGQLGDGTTIDRLVPTAVANAVGGAAVVFASLEAGVEYTCGLTTGGKAYCWGYGDTGQTGDGGTGPSESAAPKAVVGTVSFTELTARANNTCGLSVGALYCWGSNANGQLGGGTIETHTVSSPTLSLGGPFAALAAGATAPDNGGLGVHTCALTSSGAAYCWGHNALGMLGDGSTLDRHTPTAVTGPGGGAAVAFAGLATSMAHTCGITSSDAVYCWGQGLDGQLGSSNDTLITPTPVVLGRPGVTSVTLGSTTIAIDGSTTYNAVLLNPGTTLTGVALDAQIVQGTTLRAAGGTIVNCAGFFDGILSHGSCTTSWEVNVSNANTGSGTLVPGPATLRFYLFSGTTVFDTKSVPITLQ
ncbi:MAG TPA: hypothetical protein VMY76_11955 [Gemmatimonadales bacterium]|nr:hypothetical protein [Gemmatimonadales bacterium]